MEQLAPRARSAGSRAIRAAAASPRIALALALLSAPLAAQETACRQDHPGRQHRLESVAKRGDARMAWSAGAHATLYAIERFGLQGKYDGAAIKRAQDGMYKYLQWKLGSPSAVAAQFVTAGYKHFDKAYSDEAAGILVGMLDFADEKPEVVVPTWMLNWMRDKIGSEQNVASVKSFLETEVGIVPPLSDQIAQRAVAELAKKIPEELAVFMPKQYDVNNDEVRAFIAAQAQYASASPTASPALKRVRPRVGLRP